MKIWKMIQIRLLLILIGLSTSMSQKDKIKKAVALEIDGPNNTVVKIFDYIPAVDNKSLPEMTMSFSKDFDIKFDAKDKKLRAFVVEVDKLLKKNVDESLRAETPVFVFFSRENSGFSDDVLRNMMRTIYSYMTSGDFQFKFKKDYVQIVSQDSKMLYLWVAINYLAGVFANQRTKPVGVVSGDKKNFQIAYVPSKPIIYYEQQVDIGEDNYPVYVRTYRHMPFDAIQQSIVEARWASPHNPCTFTGDKWIKKNRQKQKLVGNWEPKACEDEIKRHYFANETQCLIPPCIQYNYVPNFDDTKFYGLGSVAYPGMFLTDWFTTHNITLKFMKDKADVQCSKVMGYGIISREVCFATVLIPLVLKKEMGFHDDSQILSTLDLSLINTEWGYGAVLMQLRPEIFSLSDANSLTHSIFLSLFYKMIFILLFYFFL